MQQTRTYCPYCREKLETPLDAARGKHLSCVEKATGEVLEK
jgi:hypothetical protein